MISETSDKRRVSLPGRLVAVRMVLIIVAAALTLPFAITSCSGTTVGNESEMLEVFGELYEKSLAINEYVFGAGLPYDKEAVPAEHATPYYVPVSADSPYGTKAEFEAAILEVYSYQYYSSALRQTLFDGFGEGNSSKPLYSADKEGALSIDVTREGYALTGRFDVTSAKVTSGGLNKVVVKAIWKNGSTENEYEISMIKTSDGWRFDTPTY